MAADTPSSYVAGNVTLQAGTPLALGAAIQAQIDKNAPTAAVQVLLQADSANTSEILIGMNTQVGTGTPPKFGFSLAAGDNRIYGGGVGANVPIGRMYLFSASAAVLHVEVYP